MLAERLQANIFEYQSIPLDAGIIQGSYAQLEPQPSADIGDTILTPLDSRPARRPPLKTTLVQTEDQNALKKQQMTREQKSAIVEYLRSSRRTICNDKSKKCEEHIPITKSSRTLEAVLASKGEGFLHSSREHLKEVSEKLWLPTETDYVDLDSTSSNGSSNSMMLNSKFCMQTIAAPRTKCAEISSQSYTYFPVAQMVKEDTKPKKKSKKTKIKESAMRNIKPVCEYIIVRHKLKKFGKRCCNEAIDNGRCLEHKDLIQPEYKSILTTCTYIMNFYERKGLPCGKLAKTGTLCKSHSGMVDEGSLTRSFKIRLKPNKTTRVLYSKFFGACNKTYNLCVADKQIYNSRQNYTKEELIKMLRDKYVTEDCDAVDDEYKYLTTYPRQPRDRKVTTYVKNLKNIEKQYEQKIRRAIFKYIKKKYPDSSYEEIASIKNQIDKKHKKVAKMTAYINQKIIPKIKYPEIKFFKKQVKNSVAEIPKASAMLTDKYIHPYVTNSNLDKLYFINRQARKDKKLKRLVQAGLKNDLKVMKSANGKYYAIFTYTRNPEDKVEDIKSVCALDPGSRNFITAYDPHGRALIIKDAQLRIRRMHEDIQLINKFRKDHKACRKLGLHMIRNKYEKITNMVNELHYKTASILVSQYDLIFIPVMNTKQMIQDKTLPKCVKRELNALSHTKFRFRLKTKAETCGRTVYFVEERFTSKMCGNCLTLHDVGSNLEYICPSCDINLHRDINGARNIFLKRVDKVN